MTDQHASCCLCVVLKFSALKSILHKELLQSRGKLKIGQFVSTLEVQLDDVDSPLVTLSMHEMLEGHL